MKMRKFADKGVVREGKNKNIDDETRARAMASVAGLSKPKPSAGPVAVPGRGGPVAVPDKPNAGPVAVPDRLHQDQLDRLARLADESVDSSRVLETPTEAPASRSMASAAPVAARPVAAAPKAKPAIVTLQQLNAFRKEFGADKDLTDYRNAEAGGLKRRNKVNPDMVESSDYAKGGAVSASRRGDGIAQRGKTRGKMY